MQLTSAVISAASLYNLNHIAHPKYWQRFERFLWNTDNMSKCARNIHKKIWKTASDGRMRRKDTRRNICFVSCHISFNSCSVRLSWWLGAPIKSCVRWIQRPPGAARCEPYPSFWSFNSSFCAVFFFLEHGYFAEAVISANIHQAPSWTPFVDTVSAVLIKCLTDGLNSSNCYNRCSVWWEEI